MDNNYRKHDGVNDDADGEMEEEEMDDSWDGDEETFCRDRSIYFHLKGKESSIAIIEKKLLDGSLDNEGDVEQSLLQRPDSYDFEDLTYDKKLETIYDDISVLLIEKEFYCDTDWNVDAVYGPDELNEDSEADNFPKKIIQLIKQIKEIDKELKIFIGYSIYWSTIHFGDGFEKYWFSKPGTDEIINAESETVDDRIVGIKPEDMEWW